MLRPPAWLVNALCFVEGFGPAGRPLSTEHWQAGALICAPVLHYNAMTDSSKEWTQKWIHMQLRVLKGCLVPIFLSRTVAWSATEASLKELCSCMKDKKTCRPVPSLGPKRAQVHRRKDRSFSSEVGAACRPFENSLRHRRSKRTEEISFWSVRGKIALSGSWGKPQALERTGCISVLQ